MSLRDCPQHSFPQPLWGAVCVSLPQSPQEQGEAAASFL